VCSVIQIVCNYAYSGVYAIQSVDSSVAVVQQMCSEYDMPSFDGFRSAHELTLINRVFSWWYESDDQFPKPHSSAKLGKLSGSVCTCRGFICMSEVLYYNRGWLSADILQAVQKSCFSAKPN